MTINEAKQFLNGVLEAQKQRIVSASGGCLTVSTDIFFFDANANDFNEYNETADAMAGNLSVWLPGGECEPIEYAVFLAIEGGEIPNGAGDADVNAFIAETENFANAISGRSLEEMIKAFHTEASRINGTIEQDTAQLVQSVETYKKRGLRGIGVIIGIFILLIIIASIVK